jgi:Glycosyltransferase sugar-binding region containing DXD motif
MLDTVRTFWHGERLPAAQRACLASFVRVGHAVEVYSYEAGFAAPAGVRVRDAREIMPADRVFVYGEAAGVNAGSKAGFSNVFRYRMLAKMGGYWVDADVYCLRAMPTAEVVIASERTKRGETHPTSCVLKCGPGHALAELCASTAEKQDPKTLRFGEIGPRLVAWAVRELALESAVVEPEVFCPVNWFEYERLNDAGAAELSERTLGVHLWNEMWRLSGREIPWRGVEGSVLGELSRE